MRAFVDERTGQALGVILDVVYNHLGPVRNYLPQFSERYFSDKYATEWGEPFNYDGEDSAPCGSSSSANAAYWIAEFHLDGLRLDATQSMHDASPEHVPRPHRRARPAARPARAPSSSWPRTSRRTRACADR
jgi:maltooligosyltrehalose trehalohydrolase